MLCLRLEFLASAASADKSRKRAVTVLGQKTGLVARQAWYCCIPEPAEEAAAVISREMQRGFPDGL